jgi:hypothetical protein
VIPLADPTPARAAVESTSASGRILDSKGHVRTRLSDLKGRPPAPRHSGGFLAGPEADMATADSRRRVGQAACGEDGDFDVCRSASWALPSAPGCALPAAEASEPRGTSCRQRLLGITVRTIWIGTIGGIEALENIVTSGPND